jgi:hypothetical protein
LAARYAANMNGWRLAGGCVNQKISVIVIAATLANQAPVHHRISARGLDRLRTRKNTAIISAVSASPQMPS